MTRPPAATRPLDGIPGVALEHAIAAPGCTRQRADRGARVNQPAQAGCPIADLSAGLCAHSATLAAVWRHPQLAARGRWAEVDTPAGPLPALKPPAPRSAVEPCMDAVPALGKHTEAILAGLGVAVGTRARWRASAVVSRGDPRSQRTP